VPEPDDMITLNRMFRYAQCSSALDTLGGDTSPDHDAPTQVSSFPFLNLHDGATVHVENHLHTKHSSSLWT
jgi:hypothetical protein